MKLPEIRTARLIARAAPVDAAAQLASYHARNAAFHKRWGPASDVPTTEVCAEQLARAAVEFKEGRSLRLLLFERDDPRQAVAGTVSFSEIVRGAFQACYLGYGLDERCESRGYMSEALGAAIGYVFGELKLHRIMANYQPVNERSARVLRRLGFVVEGYARDYLFIDGAWRDHVLTSLTSAALNAVE